MTTGGRQPRLMLLAGAQRAPGFLVVDFPRKAVRVADLALALASGLAVAVLWPGAKMGMRQRNRHGAGSRARRLYG